MTWSWRYSTTPEYRNELSEKLHRKSKAWLAQAIADAEYEQDELSRNGIDNRVEELKELTQPALAREAYDLACEVDRCSNGAWEVYIDPQGFHRISMRD